MTPEQQARVRIDALLQQAGWHVCNVSDANIHASTGVAIREFPLDTGFGFADYLLYVNGKACGVIEAKKEGATLTGVELQSGRYAQGLPTALPAWRRPLPFVWESTGVETHFTNGLDPEPRARAVFAFFRPELLVQWLAYLPSSSSATAIGTTAQEAPGTFLTRMRSMPQLVTEWDSGGAHYALWPAQISAITNLEKSMAANKPKALIQMATGIPRSPRIAEPLFLACYIEKAGTGTLDMISQCAQAGLPAPEFRQDGGQFIQTLWRPKGADLVPGTESQGTKSGTKSGPSRDQVEILAKANTGAALTDLMTVAGRTNRTKFRDQVIKPLLDQGLLEMTLPDKPTSSQQKYRLTPEGAAWLAERATNVPNKP